MLDFMTCTRVEPVGRGGRTQRGLGPQDMQSLAAGMADVFDVTQRLDVPKMCSSPLSVKDQTRTV